MSEYVTTLHSLAHTFRGTPALTVLFPLLTFIGPGLFGYFGYLGLARRRTLLFGRRNGAWVTGRFAMFVGATYIFCAPFMFAFMAPLSAAIIGIV
jgi:hypothetical protein